MAITDCTFPFRQLASLIYSLPSLLLLAFVVISLKLSQRSIYLQSKKRIHKFGGTKINFLETGYDDLSLEREVAYMAPVIVIHTTPHRICFPTANFETLVCTIS